MEFYLLITFTNEYQILYEKFKYVFILTQKNVDFAVFKNEQNVKYKVIKNIVYDGNYNETIGQLMHDWPFKFERVFFLDQHLNLQQFVIRPEIYNAIENKYDPSKIKVVVAYYNEDLSWLKYLRKECCIDDILLISKKHKHHPEYETVSLPNVGKESHSFMWYIVNNYENLPENVFFCQGGITSNEMKYLKFMYVVNNLSNVNRNGVIALPGQLSFRYGAFDYDFKIDEWTSSNPLNENFTRKLVPSKVRPFGKWYTTFITDDLTKISKYGVSYNGIFCTTRDSILRFPKRIYEELFKQSSVAESTEVGHYLERSYYSMFVNNYLIDRIRCQNEFHIFNIVDGKLLDDNKTSDVHINNRVYLFSLLLKDALLSIGKKVSLKIGYDYSDIGIMSCEEIVMKDCDIVFHIVDTYPSKRRIENKKRVQLGSFAFEWFGKYRYAEETKFVEKMGETASTSNKIVWYGNIQTNPIRQFFYSIAKQYPDTFHVVNVDKFDSDIWDNPKFVSVPEQVKFAKYLIDLPGNGWSERLQTLMFSNRPLLVVNPHFADHWFYELVPWKHYIPIKSDLSDLQMIVKWCFENEKIANEIAANALYFAKNNLKREHEVGRIRESILRVWYSRFHFKSPIV
jgi:hypothetical protein